jgi:hypothetical protein
MQHHFAILFSVKSLPDYRIADGGQEYVKARTAQIFSPVSRSPSTHANGNKVAAGTRMRMAFIFLHK